MVLREVGISGVGLISPFGIGAKASLDAYLSGVKASPELVPELASFPIPEPLAFKLPPHDPGTLLGSRKMLKYMSEASVLGCIAAREAFAEANAKERFKPERIGLFAATGLAAAEISEIRPVIENSIGDDGRISCRKLGSNGLNAANPLLSFKILSNIPPCLVSIQESVKGPNYIFNPWEGQGAAALLEAWLAVANGELDCALAGAADYAVHPAIYVHLWKSGVLHPGEYPSCGAAYLFLEPLSLAQRDGRRVYARLGSLSLERSNTSANDPLAGRIGRTFAAAPALSLVLAALSGEKTLALSGVDRQLFRAELEAAS